MYLPAAKMVPLADPKVEMATESGMIHENMPKILLPNVWNKTRPNANCLLLFSDASDSHHGDGVADGHLRGRHHRQVGDVDEQVADCDLSGDFKWAVRQDLTPE